MPASATAARWRNVTAAEPCPICARGDWCSVTTDGSVVICRRVDTGEGEHRVDRAGADYWIYRLNGRARTEAVSPDPGPPEPERAPPEVLDRVYDNLLRLLLLSEEHREDLRRRGLSEEEITRRGYGTMPADLRACDPALPSRLAFTVKQRRDLLKVPGVWERPQDGMLGLDIPAGLLIPVRDVQRRIIALKVRRDANDGGPRYVYVSSRKVGGPSPGTPVHVPVFNGPTEVVRLTEGELKADVATALSGILTVGVAGVSCWRPAIPVLRELRAKVVRLSFDADAKRNPQVARALDATARALAAEGFSVEIESWPEADGKGIDDLLAAGRTPTVLVGDAALRAAGVGGDPGGAAAESDAVPVSAPPVSAPPDLAAPPTWPTLAPEALHGLAGDVVRAIEPHTEADPVALLAQFLVAFGNVIGRGPHFRVEADKHYTNLFIALVGETAKGRKGTSWGHVLRLFETVDSTWAKTRVLSGLSSGEGLIWSVRDAIEQQQPVKERGRVIDYETVTTDPGVEDKRLLVREAEFASTLRVLGRDGNTLSAIIRDAWDTGDLRVLTKNNPTRATGAHISIIAHITRDELLRYLESTEAGNGFANRFLWLCVKRSKLLPRGGRIHEVDFAPLVRKLREAIDFARGAEQVTFSEPTWAVWERVYPELSAGQPGLLGAVTARAEAQTARLAVLYALLDRSATVRVEHLRAALAVWEYCQTSARFVFGDALGDPDADAILAALRRSEDGMTQTEVSNLLGRHRDAKRIGRTLAKLEALGLARCQDDRDTGGRPARRWFAT